MKTHNSLPKSGNEPSKAHAEVITYFSFRGLMLSCVEAVTVGTTMQRFTRFLFREDHINAPRWDAGTMILFGKWLQDVGYAQANFESYDLTDDFDGYLKSYPRQVVVL